MSKFKTRVVQVEKDTYCVEFSIGGILRNWQSILYWDTKFKEWLPRTFNQKRAEQVVRQIKSYRDVLTFQAETYK